MGDGAIGPHVVKTLEAYYAFPEQVALIDAGKPGLDLTAHVAGLETLIVVHSVDGEGIPGHIRHYDKAAVLARGAPAKPSESPHIAALRDALQQAEMRRAAPAKVRVLGVIPGRIAPVVGLTREVRNAIPWIVADVITELRCLGVTVPERRPRAVPDTWWDSPSGSEVPKA